MDGLVPERDEMATEQHRQVLANLERSSSSISNTSSTSSTDFPLVGQLTTSELKGSSPLIGVPATPPLSDGEEFDDQRLPADGGRPENAPVRGVGGEHGEPGLKHGKAGIPSIPVELERLPSYKDGRKRGYVLKIDGELRELLASRERPVVGRDGKRRRGKFRDLVFERQHTAFDRANPKNEGSQFRGFFTLIWIAVAIMMLRTFAMSYRYSGYVTGIDILSIMFQPSNLVDCLLTDCVMFYGSTLWCVPFQKAAQKGYISWNKTGWIYHTVFQAVYLGAVIAWTLHREWPWIQSVFITLHLLVVLMKMHSYSFYNGHLSKTFKRRNALRRTLKDIEASEGLSTGVEDQVHSLHHRRRSSVPRDFRGPASSWLADLDQLPDELTPAQIDRFHILLESEIDACNSELLSQDGIISYPNNLTWFNYLEYLHFPTVVYELSYPRQESISWPYVLEKTLAVFGVLGIMIVVSQTYMYPVVIHCNELRDTLPLGERLKEFPWILADLVFPFLAQYLCVWYLIWELILNLLGELTRFADRGFYGAWWNSEDWEHFAREWNRPVHSFLLRHVYHSSISTLHVSRQTATLITFLLSSLVHELVMWAVFKRLRGYLLLAQMTQLPIIALSRTKWLREKKVLGNVQFWLGILTGPTLLCSLYLVI